MKKWILLCVILIAILIIIIISGRKQSSPFGKKNTSFAVASVSDITSIEISDKEGVLKLYIEGDAWYVNDGRHTRSSAINFILKTIGNIEIKSPMSDEMFQNQVTARNLSPVNVKVYAKNRLLNSYIVFKTSDDPGGNVMMKKPGSKPFIVHIPGYDVNPGSHFISDPMFWYPNTIFGLGQKEIETVELDYPSEPDSSVVIRSGEQGFSVTLGGVEALSVDTSSVMRFLSYFSYVPFENWVFDLPESEKSEIINERQVIIIRIKTHNGDKIILKCWLRLIREGSDVRIDTDHLWGSLNDGRDIFVIRYFDLDPLIKTPEYFINE